MPTHPFADSDDARQRICPGMHLANVSVVSGLVFRNQDCSLTPDFQALAAMKLLWAFEFRPATDPKTGKTVQLDIMKKRDVSGCRSYALIQNFAVAGGGVRFTKTSY